MNYTPVRILWISPDKNLVQEYILYLEQCGHPVTHVIEQSRWQTDLINQEPKIVIVSHQTSAEVGISVCLNTQSEAESNSLFSLLISDNISVEEKETYFQAGGNELIIPPFGHKELLAKFKPFLNLCNESASLSAQLAESSQMALLAMESSSDLGGIISFVKDAITATSYTELANHMFEATSLYADSSIIEIKGHHSFEYFSSKKEIDPDMKQFMESNKSDKRVIQFDDVTQINQNHIVLLVEGLPVNDPAKMGRISDSLVILSDIANRFAQTLAIEESIHKSEESRQRFLNTLSHELRTPLNSILGFSKALISKKADKPIGDTGLDALKRIIDNTEQVNTIISTLLEISGSYSQDSAYPPIDVDRLLLRVRNNFSILASNKDLDFQFSSLEGIILQSDEKKVLSMLNHLMDNALKFTDTGQISLTVGVEEDTAFGNSIYFDISDTGIGIDKINHHRIFSEIGQLNTEHDRRHYGIGLGLYYVKQISQQLGGSVSVTSKLNEGSTFRLSLPINLSEAPIEEENEIIFF